MTVDGVSHAAAGVVHRVRHPESDRVRGHLSAARGGAGPLHGEGGARLSRRRRWSRASSHRVLGGFEADARRATGSMRWRTPAGSRTFARPVAGCGSSRASSPYVTAIVRATRSAPVLTLGASPRGSVALLKMAQAAALLDGRDVRRSRRREVARARGAPAPGDGGARARAGGCHSGYGAPRHHREDRGAPMMLVPSRRWLWWAGALALVAPAAALLAGSPGLLLALDVVWIAAPAGGCGRRAGRAGARAAARGAGGLLPRPTLRRAVSLAPARRAAAHVLVQERLPEPLGGADTPLRRLEVPPRLEVEERLELQPLRRGIGTGGTIDLRILGPLGLAWRQSRIELPWTATVYPSLRGSLAPRPADTDRCGGARPGSETCGIRARAGCSRGSASGSRATTPASSTGRRRRGAASRSPGSTRTSGGSRSCW